jgi:hypothetical protein
MRSVLALALVLGSALPMRVAAEPSRAPSHDLENPEAIEYLERAQGHFNDGNYVAAAAELEAAYAIEPSPKLLYAWAQAERYAGNCEKAVPLYEQFIATGPDEEGLRAAAEKISECDEAETKEPGPKSTKSETKEDADPSIKPAYRDWLGATFVGLGVATGVAGGVLLGIGRREVVTSPGAPSEDDYFDEVAAGRNKYTAGIALASVGGAFILAGIIRYSVLAAKNRKQRKAQTSLLAPPRGLGLGLGVRF